MDTSGLPPDLTCPEEIQWAFSSSLMGESEHVLWASQMGLGSDLDEETAAQGWGCSQQ